MGEIRKGERKVENDLWRMRREAEEVEEGRGREREKTTWLPGCLQHPVG